MDTEMMINQMEQDFEFMAKEHEGAAENEYIWSLGAPDAETTKMHIENMEQHKLLARMYRRMKDDCLAFVETYDDDAHF
jgi:Rod binding domain-containing protein